MKAIFVLMAVTMAIIGACQGAQINKIYSDGNMDIATSGGMVTFFSQVTNSQGIVEPAVNHPCQLKTGIMTISVASIFGSKVDKVARGYNVGNTVQIWFSDSSGTSNHADFPVKA